MKGEDGKNNDDVDEQKPKSFENDSYLPMFALWQELKYYLFIYETDIRLPRMFAIEVLLAEVSIGVDLKVVYFNSLVI